jgi:hypothetical protein
MDYAAVEKLLKPRDAYHYQWMRQFDRYGEITNYSVLQSTGYRPRTCHRKGRTIYAHTDDVLFASLQVKHAASLVRNLFLSRLERSSFRSTSRQGDSLWYFAVYFVIWFFPAIEWFFLRGKKFALLGGINETSMKYNKYLRITSSSLVLQSDPLIKFWILSNRW